MLVLTFLVGLLSLVIYAAYDRFSRAGRLMRKIPGPRSWPIIGNSLSYGLPPDEAFKFMRTLPKKYGHISQIHGLNTRIVNISSPEDIEKILSSPQYNNKKDPYTFLAPWLGDGLLTSDGDKWLHRRKLLTKTFHFKILRKFLETFRTGAASFVKRVENETVKQKTDLVALIYPTALRIICETAMGFPMAEDGPVMNKYVENVYKFGDCFALRTAKAWLQNEFLFKFTSVSKMQSSALRNLHEFTTNVINERRITLNSVGNQHIKSVDDYDSITYENNEKMAMLDLLLESEKSGLITHEGIREEVDTFMFEGFDTTTLTQTYFLMAVANEPEVQNKLHEEMERIFGDSQRLPTTEDLNEMKYLENCIKETLRLYPVAPLIVRHLINDTVLSGYTVPANTDCFVFIYDMHHRADLFPDPERFDPDRFLPENSLNRNPYSYVPFSAGQRNCIGQKFAILEVKTTMASVLRKYRLEPVTKPADIEYRFNMLLQPNNPVYVRFRSK